MDGTEARSDSPSGHMRTPSHTRRQALPRRSTRGPLDSDDPLVQSPSPSPARHLAVPTSSRTRSRSPRSPVRNFAFLLESENFVALDHDDIPPPLQPSTQTLTTPASSTTLTAALKQGHYRLAAIQSAHLLRTHPDTTDHSTIFSLLFTRLSCLQLSGLSDVAAQESKCLQDLNAPIYREASKSGGKHLVPWNLRVLVVRLQALGFDDWRRGIMSYYELAREARAELRPPDADITHKELWTARLEDISVRIASALVEMGDLEGAGRFLRSLPASPKPGGAGRQRLALVCLSMGDVGTAAALLDADPGQEEEQSVLGALRDMADGDYSSALENWITLRSSSTTQQDQNQGVVEQNIATCLVYTGKIQEARRVLEEAVDQGTISNDILFNLASIYELCSTNPMKLKEGLVGRVAVHEPRVDRPTRTGLEFKM